MKKAKRILTVILAICLTFSMVPAVSAAEEIKNPAISFNDWDEYVEEMRRKNYGVNSDTLPEGYDQSVIDAINNNIDNSVPVESGTSLEGAMEAVASSSVATKIGETASVQNTTSDSTSTAVAESFTVDPVADPFNMAAGAGDSVSLATGALTYEKTLLSLPGRNGHDLNISVRYNSDSAVITGAAYSENDGEQIIDFNQFAIGWSFGFPYITTDEFYGFSNEETLCLPSGGSYKIVYDSSSKKWELEHYKMADMSIDVVELNKQTLKETTTAETDEENIIIAYKLNYIDGRKDYFDYTYGNIIKSEDRFGNKIVFEYGEELCYKNSFWDFLFRMNSVVQKMHVLSKITDSTGNVVTFKYDKSVTDFDKYINKISIAVNGVKYAEINLKHESSYNGKIDVVESIVDGEGYKTSFDYEEMITHVTGVSESEIISYNIAGSNFIMTGLTLPTSGTINYEYEKARRSCGCTYYLDGYAHQNTGWREVYKVSERTDSGDNKICYQYENDHSGYPYSSIDKTTGYVYDEDFTFRTMVTEGQLSTVHEFDYRHNKISEETYSINSGVNQLASKTDTMYSVVINNKIYTVTLENGYLTTYTYNEVNTENGTQYKEKVYEPVFIGTKNYIWADETVYLKAVKSYNEYIYAFTYDIWYNLVIYKFDTLSDQPAWEKECTYNLNSWYYSVVVRYNPEEQNFYIFAYDNSDNRESIAFLKYCITSKTVVVRNYSTVSCSFPQYICFICLDGNTAYFNVDSVVYRFVMGESGITKTSKTFDVVPWGGFLADGEIYIKADTEETENGKMICDVYRFDFDSNTVTPVSALTDVTNITVGADGKLYYTKIIDTDSSDTGEANRQVLMSYDISVGTSTPEIEYYCFSDTDEYTLLTTYGRMYLKTNDLYEIVENTTAKQTRIRADYTYNDYDQMIGYKKSVTEGAAISHQGGEYYTYVPGYNAILTHTDILGNVTKYCYGGDCDCTDGHNEELSTYYIPLRTTQYAETDNAVVTTNVLSDDKKKVVTSTTVYDGATYVTANTYDDTNEDGYPGNILKTVVTETGTNTKISETDYTYDADGHFVISQTAKGIVTNDTDFIKDEDGIAITAKFTYNDFGQVTCETKVVGQDDTTGDENDDIITSYDYNKNGWQTRVTYPDNTYVATTYNIGSTNKVTTNYNNEYSTADYFDSMGRATKQTKKVGSGSEKTIAQYSYYLGRIESVSDGTKADYYVYDNFDRVKRVNHGNPTGTSYYSQVTYDDLNLKSTVTLSNYQTTTTYYDIAGRIIKEELGTSAKSVTTYTYDYMGNVKTVTDPNGNTTTNNYNDRGQLTSVANALEQFTRYEYDVYGNVSKVTTPGNSMLHYEYDNAGRLLTTTNALGASEHFAYDTLGNLIAQKDRKGQVTNYTYDSMNRPLSKATGNTSTTGNLSTAYTYDTLGNVLTMTDGADVTTYDYTGDGLLSGITTPDGESISYSYNDAGYLTGVTDYSGYTYTYTYGGTGDVTGITQKENGTQISNISISYVYPGVFTWWMLRHAETGDSDRNYFYDDKGRVTTVDCGMFDFVGHTTSYVRQYYTYDSAGNITQKTTTTDGTTSYVYDSLNRLTAENITGGSSTTYTYDANNNIAQKVMQPDVGAPTIKSYTYDSANRMTKEAVAFMDDVTETTFGYDANGNMLYKLCNNSAEEFAYDAWNRLTEYTSAGGVETTYTYNGDNRRTSKTTGNTTINYYWDRDYVSMETVGNVTNTNFVTPLGIVSRTQDEDYTFLIRDAHGDVVERFTNGERDTYSYDAYGNEKTPDSNDDNPLRYCGEYYDTESGLIYLRNRYYDPELGRFINEDSHWNPDNMIYGDDQKAVQYTVVNGQKIFFDKHGKVIKEEDCQFGVSECLESSHNNYERNSELILRDIHRVPEQSSIIQSSNLYGYALNNPLNYIDSSGESATVAGAVTLFIAGGIFLIGILTIDDLNKTVGDVLKTRRGSILRAPLPPGFPGWDAIRDLTIAEILRRAQGGDKAFKEVWKLLTNGRFSK